MTAPSDHLEVLVDRCSADEWNATLLEFDDATIYQTWAYGQVSWGERQLSHLMLREAGQVVAMAQVRVVHVPLLRRGVAYVRWGPLWRPRGVPPDPARFRQVARALVEEYVHRRKLLLRLVPNVFADDDLAVDVRTIASEAGFAADRGTSPYRTIRLKLQPSLDELRRRLDQKWRNQLNRAERNGLRVLEGCGDELFEKFLSIYQEMMARKQFDTTVDPARFRRIQDAASAASKMLLLLAEKDGTLLSGLVCSAHGDTGIYLLGATSDAGMKTKSSYLLHWRAIQRLKERGLGWYDLGGINPQRNPGVYHFKRGFGGVESQQILRCECGAGGWSALAVHTVEASRASLQRLKQRLSLGNTLRVAN